MNKLFFGMLSMLLASSCNVQAQNEMKKNELNLSIGALASKDSDDGLLYGYDFYRPVLSVGYMRNLNSVWSVGATFTYSKEEVGSYGFDCNCKNYSSFVSNDAYQDYADYPSVYFTRFGFRNPLEGIQDIEKYYVNKHNFNLMATGKVKWLRRKVFNLYCKVGVGGDLVYNYASYTENSTEWKVAYQVTPFAIEAGSKATKCFAELGYGAQGVLNLGVSHSF